MHRQHEGLIRNRSYAITCAEGETKGRARVIRGRAANDASRAVERRPRRKGAGRNSKRRRWRARRRDGERARGIDGEVGRSGTRDGRGQLDDQGGRGRGNDRSTDSIGHGGAELITRHCEGRIGDGQGRRTHTGVGRARRDRREAGRVGSLALPLDGGRRIARRRDGKGRVGSHGDGRSGGICDRRGSGSGASAERVIISVGDVERAAGADTDARGALEARGGADRIGGANRTGRASDRGHNARSVHDLTEGVVTRIGDEEICAADDEAAGELEARGCPRGIGAPTGAIASARQRGDGRCGDDDFTNSMIGGIGDIEVGRAFGGDRTGVLERGEHAGSVRKTVGSRRAREGRHDTRADHNLTDRMVTRIGNVEIRARDGEAEWVIKSSEHARAVRQARRSDGAGQGRDGTGADHDFPNRVIISIGDVDIRAVSGDALGKAERRRGTRAVRGTCHA